MSEPKSEAGKLGEAIGNFIMSGGTRTSSESDSKSDSDKGTEDDAEDYMTAD